MELAQKWKNRSSEGNKGLETAPNIYVICDENSAAFSE